AAALLCDHRGYAADHAAVELRSTDGKRPENRDTMDTGVPLPRLAGALLSPYNRAWPLVHAHLRLASVGVSLVSACTIHLGLLTSICDLCGREDCVQHSALPRHPGAPRDGARGCYFHDAGRGADGSTRRPHADEFFHHARSVDRSGNRRGISLCRGAAAPVSGTHLMRRR